MPWALASAALSGRVHWRSSELKGEGEEKGIHSRMVLKRRKEVLPKLFYITFPFAHIYLKGLFMEKKKTNLKYVTEV